MPPQVVAQSRRAFSLVELLVVISIVAVLVSMTLPVLVKARVEARRAVCMSNLRQQGIALTTYCMNQRDGSWPVVGGVWAEWLIAIAPYVGWPGKPALDPQERPSKYIKVFRCPEYSSFPAISVSQGDSYGRNMTIMAGDMTRFTGRNNSPASFTAWSAEWAKRRTYYTVQNSPSRIYLHSDLHLYEVEGWGPVTSIAASRAHFGRANLGFIDGHVENGAKGERTDLWFLDGSAPGWY